jgi:hypothetical protein
VPLRQLSRTLAGSALLAVALAVPSAGASRGPQVNVSQAPGAQAEATVAIGTGGDTLLAGSNSFEEGSMRVYTSGDGGDTWSSSLLYAAPSGFLASCASDPTVAIDRRGRQYYAFIRTTPCMTGKPRLFVATRGDASSSWRAPIAVAKLGGALADDKPAMAVDLSPSSPHFGRAYVVWVRVLRGVFLRVLLSWSDDGGRTWSAPVRVNRTGRELTYPSVAVSRTGVVYVAWDDAGARRLSIARSTDGGARFGDSRTAAAFSIVPIPHCGSGIVIRAVRGQCLQANPVVSVDTSRGSNGGRVYLSFLKKSVVGATGIFIAAFDSRLRRLPFTGAIEDGNEVAPIRGSRTSSPDRFWPASAVDPSNGTLWVCFYETTRGTERRKATYTCTASRNGGRTFARLMRAASIASDETQPEADARGYGDYEGVAAANGVAHPIWTDGRDLATLGEEIYTTTLREADLGS